MTTRSVLPTGGQTLAYSASTLRPGTGVFVRSATDCAFGSPASSGCMTARTRFNTSPHVTLSSAAENQTGESHVRTRLRIPSSGA